MKKSTVLLIFIIVALGVFAIRFLFGGNEDTWLCINGAWIKHGNPRAEMPEDGCGEDEVYDKSDLIRVTNPLPNQAIKSPLEVSGKARGNWFFEASFPVKLVDDNGILLAAAVAQAQADWMTEDFVLFKAELKFSAPESSRGELILEKDNPSGLPENSGELRIPIIFEPELLTIKVYFGTEQTGGAPNFDCQEVAAKSRQVIKTQAVARAALEELLKGPTESEKQAGFLTSINPGVKIQKLTIENGIAKVDFSKELEEAVGGSCRVTAIRAQITETLKQFETVKEVIISIDGRTEDILQP